MNDADMDDLSTGGDLPFTLQPDPALSGDGVSTGGRSRRSSGRAMANRTTRGRTGARSSGDGRRTRRATPGNGRRTRSTASARQATPMARRGARSATTATLELVGDLSRTLRESLQGLVPPPAVRHLLNAQREVVLALTSVIEHYASRSGPRNGRRRRGARKPPTRVSLD